MNCAECREAIIASLEGVLEASSCEALDGHLASCPACRAERDGISRLRERLLRDAAAIRERSVTSTVMRRVLASPRPARRRLVSAWVPTAAALVVALLGGLYWLLSPADPRRPEGGGPVLPGAERPARSPGAGPDHASGASPALAGNITIRGRVVRAAEIEGAATPGPSAVSLAGPSPVEGAVVRVRRRADGPAADGSPLPVPATTARDGGFELAGVPEDEPCILEVDDGTSAILALEVPGRGDPVLDLSDLTLEPCAHLEVRLVGPDGAPVEGARVAAERSRRAPFSPLGPLESRMGRPIGGGAYRLEPLWPGPVRVHASAPDCLPKSIQVWVPRPDPLEVRLESGLAIAGRVVTAGGEPIAGAEVRVENHPPDEGAVVRTGPDGTFSTGRVLTDAPRRVTVTAGGYAEGLVRHDPGGRADLSIVLVPEPRGTVSGSVVDEEGRPVEGARVIARAFGRRGGSAVSGVGGEFQIGGLDDGTYALHADQPEFAGSTAPLVDVSQGSGVGGQVLRMRRGLVVVGSVADAVTGAPVSGAEVCVARLDGRGQPGERRTARTGADGAFRIAGLRAGAGSVSAVAAGYLPALPESLDLAPAASEVRLVLEKGGSIRGRILTASGAPVPGASVRPSVVVPCDDRSPAAERLRELEVSSGSDGAYVLDGLPPHPEYSVIVRHPELAAGERRGVAVPAGEDLEGMDVVLADGGSIRGRLVSRGAGAFGVGWIAAADVGKARAEREAGSCRSYLAYPYSSGTVAEDGRFEIRHLAPGTYSLSLDLPPAILDGVAVAGDTVVDVGDLAIDRPPRPESEREPEPPAARASSHWGTIAGRVSADDPDALLDFEVTAVDRRTRGSQGHSDRDPAGRFEMPVAPGTYVLRATAPGHALAESDEVTVEAGERVEAVVIALARGGSIEGVVIDASTELPVEGASVSVEGDPRVSSSATSDASGRFAISMAPSGAARLRVRDPAYVEKLVDGTGVRPGEVWRVVVELDRAGAIEGTVLRGGRPVPDALVKVLRAATREPVGIAGADAAGRFEVAGLPSGDHVVTLPREPGFAESPIRVEAGHVARVELVAEGPGPIRLSARLTAGGAPAHGHLSVRDLARGWSSEGIPPISESDDGRFTVDLPGPGTYSLDFEPFGRNAQIGGFRFEVPDDAEARLLEIELPSGEVAGIVVDEATGAPPGAGFVWAVEMSERSRCPWLLAPLSTCSIDGRGRFVLPCLAPGTYAVHAWAEGHAGRRVDGVRVGAGREARELRIALGPEARIVLRVVDESGAPVGRVGAMVRDESGAWLLPSSTRVRSEPGGLAIVGGLAPGAHTVTVFAKGFALATVGAEAGASPAEASVVLRRPGTAIIRVLDERGAPGLGAEVTVLDAAGIDAAPPCSLPAPGWPPGEAVLRDLAPGTYRATARKDGRVSREETFTVTAGEVTEVRLVLGSGG